MIWHIEFSPRVAQFCSGTIFLATMKKYSGIIILISLLMNSLCTLAQQESADYKNRICVGLGGEDGFFGVDYSKGIYKSKIFLGIGCGLGTGWTGYVRYEPLYWHGLSPFVSSGISHSFGGTLIISPGTSVFSASAGIICLPKPKSKNTITVSIGITYYALLTHETKEMNGFGPLIKIGMAFPQKNNWNFLKMDKPKTIPQDDLLFNFR